MYVVGRMIKCIVSYVIISIKTFLKGKRILARNFDMKCFNTGPVKHLSYVYHKQNLLPHLVAVHLNFKIN